MRLVVTAVLLVGSLALAQSAAPAKAAAPASPAGGAGGGAAPAPAAGGAKLDGAKLFQEKTCIACHGKDAKTPILPEYPKLAGQNPVYAERQMKDIKAGVRNNGNTAAMKGIMVLVNEEEIHALAQYVGSLK